MQGTPLTAADIRSYLLEVASTMATKGPQHRLLIVGGALLAWQGMRQSTLDVDSAYVGSGTRGCSHDSCATSPPADQLGQQQSVSLLSSNAGSG